MTMLPCNGTISEDFSRYHEKAGTKRPAHGIWLRLFRGAARKHPAQQRPKLLSYDGLWGSGEEYAYEVLNFADGRRNAQEIRDAVSAEYGPVPLELVAEYLEALKKIGVVEEVKQ